jgi:hypothetical protein
MAYTIMVTGRTVNDDGSIQYQMDDGSGILFTDAAEESTWCDETNLETIIRPIIKRIAVCKTVHDGHEVKAGFSQGKRQLM